MCSMSVLCPLCANSSFTSIDALRVSLIKAANGPLPCPICNELFLGLDKLTIHLFSHTNVHVENSSQVGKTLETAATGQNETNHQQAGQQQPQEVQQNSQQAPITCDICEFNFSNQKLLDMHFRLVHQNDNQPSPTQPAPLSSATVSNCSDRKIHDFKCHLCAKTFKMKGSLRVHLKVVHLVGVSASNKNSPKLSICDRIRHKEEAASTANTKSNISLSPQPSSPGVSFLVNTNLTSPVLALPSTSSGVDHKVSIDNEMLQSVSGNVATAHMSPHNVLFVLSAANLLTTSLSAQSEEEKVLDFATKTNTENAKIWECDVCSKSFTTKYFLKKHKRLHTGEMPYTCEICARTFTFQQSYHKHLLYHSDEKPHVCATCGRAFKELSTLHNHERIHSGEKPFKCEVCDKSFRQRVSFLVHTRIHTGVMPYKCDVCQKSFRYKVSQRTHKCLSRAIGETTGGTSTSNATSSNEEVVDQISENFIKAFLENANNVKSPTMHESQCSPLSAEIAAITLCQNSNSSHKSMTDANEHHISAKNIMDEVMLSKTIDDIVVESCNKMGIGNSPMVTERPSPSMHLSSQYSANNGTNGSSSPSFRFQNMRLYSPDMMQHQLEQQQRQGQEINGETSDFSHFLLGNAGPQLL